MFLGAVEIYCEAVEQLSQGSVCARLKSRGLRAFREYLTEYVASASFRDLACGNEEAEVGSVRDPVFLLIRGRQRHGSPLRGRE